MARSVRSTPYAFVAEVARYLALEPADVKRCIEKDRLPATRLPKARRVVYRIYLPDFHEWVIGRSANAGEQLRTYAKFLEHFNAVARLDPQQKSNPQTAAA